MNTFWLKIAILAVVVIIGVFFIPSLLPEKKPDAVEQMKGFSDVVREDDRRLRAEPKLKKPDVNETQQEQKVVEEKSQELQQTAEEPNAGQASKQTKLEFVELSEIDQIEAERLLEAAIKGRSIGRLPPHSFKLMVDNCREIISRFPGSVPAFKAKRMLNELPDRFKVRYRITAEETDLGGYE